MPDQGRGVFEKSLIALSLVGFLAFGYIGFNESLLLRLMQSGHLGQQVIGDTSYKHNDVRRRFGSSLSWTHLNEKEKLYNFDTVFVGKDSSAEIELKSGIKLELGPNTLVVLTEADNNLPAFDFQMGTFSIDLAGHGQAVIRNNQQDVTIKATQNGSKVQIGGSGQNIEMLTLNGEAEISSQFGQAKVSTGEMATVDKKIEKKKAVVPLKPSLAKTIWLNPSDELHFEWTRSQSQTATFEVSLSPSFEKVEKTLDVSPLTSLKFKPEAWKESTYYWRIREESSSEATSAWFQVRLKKAPILIFPKENEKMSLNGQVGKDVLLVWDIPEGTSQSELMVSTDPEFKNAQTIKTKLGFVRKTLAPGHYYWKVRVIDGPHAGAVSLTKEFSIDDGASTLPVVADLPTEVFGPPEPPVQATPQAPPKVSQKTQVVTLKFDRRPASVPGEATEVAVNPPVLRWEAGAIQEAYKVQIAKDSHFKTILHEQKTDKPQWIWSQAKPGKYFYRVQSDIPDLEVTDGSNVGRLHILLPPPKVEPIIKSEVTTSDPAQMEKGTFPVDLTWTKVPMAESYKVEVAEDMEFEKITFEGATEETTIQAQLPASPRLYYRVRALSSTEPVSQPSPVGRISTSATLTLADPKPLEPEDNSAVVVMGEGSSTIVFKWSKVPHAKSYEFEISRHPDFREGDVITRQKATSATVVLNRELPAGTLYWRARARYDDYTSNWSQPRAISVQKADL